MRRLGTFVSFQFSYPGVYQYQGGKGSGIKFFSPDGMNLAPAVQPQPMFGTRARGALPPGVYVPPCMGGKQSHSHSHGHGGCKCGGKCGPCGKGRRRMAGLGDDGGDDFSGGGDDFGFDTPFVSPADTVTSAGDTTLVSPDDQLTPAEQQFLNTGFDSTTGTYLLPGGASFDPSTGITDYPNGNFCYSDGSCFDEYGNSVSSSSAASGTPSGTPSGGAGASSGGGGGGSKGGGSSASSNIACLINPRAAGCPGAMQQTTGARPGAAASSSAIPSWAWIGIAAVGGIALAKAL